MSDLLLALQRPDSIFRQYQSLQSSGSARRKTVLDLKKAEEERFKPHSLYGLIGHTEGHNCPALGAPEHSMAKDVITEMS